MIHCSFLAKFSKKFSDLLRCRLGEIDVYILVASYAVNGCRFGQLLTHSKPGEAYTYLLTASREAGPGTTHMCIFEICLWSLLIHEFDDSCYLHNFIFDLPKY